MSLRARRSASMLIPDVMYGEIVIMLKFLIFMCIYIETWAIGEIILSPEFTEFLKKVEKKFNKSLDK
jgi:hypothetical protein